MKGAMQLKGFSHEAVVKELINFTGKDVDWRTGRVMTGLYDPGKNAHKLAVEAYSRFLPKMPYM
jgi:hypothetical protein